MGGDHSRARFDPIRVLASMTLAEKARLGTGRDQWTLHGVPRAGLPPIRVADGPHGLRKPRDGNADPGIGRSVPATCFPTASAMAATWDPALVEEVGTALGREARAEGVSVLLGPGANIKRTPLCGRNFEYFSEDPLLSGRLAAAWIRGVQRTGVAATLKHLAANNQEHRRYSIDALVDERALREIYLASFEEAVAGGRPWTVMSAYNRLNGVFCSEHRQLLTEVLREAWDFDGVVISDWGATHDRVAGLAAGLDLAMPGYGRRGGAGIVRAVTSGALPATVLDQSTLRLLTLIARTAGARQPGHTYDPEAHHELARRAAIEGTVLLRNEGHLLPLAPGGHVAVIGAFATQPRYQGAGSSVVTPTRVDDAYAEIVRLVTADGGEVCYAPGYRRDRDVVDHALLEQACDVAHAADAVLVFAGLPEARETEGVDRRDLHLPASHDALITAVTEVNPRVAVVLSNGAPVEMPWFDRVPAIVESYLGGQAGGSAVARVLFGAAEPGGRLAETFPRRWEDNPVHALPFGPRQAEYRESVYVGYRYYDSADVPVLFPFGHGLSYTTYRYSDLALDVSHLDGGGPVPLSLNLTNTGARAGTEVVQVYVHAERPGVFRPAQQLGGFAKVRLAAGESRPVAIEIPRRAFGYFSVDLGEWVTEPGRYTIRVGASSRDIRLVTVVTVVGAESAVGRGKRHAAPPAYVDLVRGRGFDRDSFASLYRRPLPDNVADGRGRYTLDTPLTDMHDSTVARSLHAALRLAARRKVADRDDPAALLIDSVLSDMPLRMLVMASRGKLGTPVLRAVLALANRHARGRSHPRRPSP